MADDTFELRWKKHQLTFVSFFKKILENKSLVDCTIVAEGQYLKAHRLILSACSSYFESLFCEPSDTHPMIILKDVPFENLKWLMEYMYKGEVIISQSNLTAFVNAAKLLKIKGFEDGSHNDNEDPAQTRVEKPPLMQKPTATTSSQLRTQPRQKIQPESSTISISSDSSGSTIWESTLPPTMGKHRHISPEMDDNSDSSRYTTSSPIGGKRRRIPKMPSEYDLAFPNNDNTFDNSKGFQSTPRVTINKVPTTQELPIASGHMNVTNTTLLPTSPKFSISLSDEPSVNRQIPLFADSGSISLLPKTPLFEATVEPINSPETESEDNDNEDPAQTRVEKPPLMPPTATTSSQLRTQPRQKIQPESSIISISSDSSGSTIWESTLPPTMGKRRHISPEMDDNSDSSSYTTSSPIGGKRRRIPKMPSEYDLAFPNNDNTFDNSKGFQSTPRVTTNKVPTSQELPIASGHMNVTNTTLLPTSPKFSISLSDEPSVNRQIPLFADSGSTSLLPKTPLFEAKVEPINPPETESIDNDYIEDFSLFYDEDDEMSET